MRKRQQVDNQLKKESFNLLYQKKIGKEGICILESTEYKKSSHFSCQICSYDGQKRERNHIFCTKRYLVIYKIMQTLSGRNG